MTYIYIYICVCVCMCVCLYVYVCIYIYMYIEKESSILQVVAYYIPHVIYIYIYICIVHHICITVYYIIVHEGLKVLKQWALWQGAYRAIGPGRSRYCSVITNLASADGFVINATFASQSSLVNPR